LLPQIIYECDIEGNLTYVNEQAFEFFRYTREDFEKGINLMQALIPEDHEKAKTDFQKVLQGEEPENPNYTALRKDNSKFPVLIYSNSVIKNYKPTGLRGVIIDITDLRKAENEIKIQNKKLKQITEIEKIGTFDWDLKTNLTTWNDEMFNIHQIPKQVPMPYENWVKNIHPDDVDETTSILAESITAKNPRYAEFRIVRPNGELRDVRASATVITDNKGNVTNAIGVTIDITEKNKAQEETLKAKEKAEESDRLKTEFINNMSHEIRTPMNGILGFSELLSTPDLAQEKLINYISIIQNSGKQLMRIIDDILEISKLGTKQVKAIENKVYLNDLFLELFSIFDIRAKENKTPLYLKKGLPDTESMVLTDSSKLNKILSNLLENALKFTNKGFIEFGYRLKNDTVVIYVKDTGIGIKPEKQEIIFERFSQEEKEVSEHAGGLGLGLSIAKENAELLGGTITLESEKGKGSTFYITIPYKPVENNNIIKTKKTTMTDKKTQTILIAEDEEVNFIYIETLLEYFVKDLIVLHAIDGKQAVELCKERSDIDFVLMDLKMPVMDGYEATKLIKEFRPDLPVIAQTAYSTPEEKEKALKAGCDDFISKPISKEIFSKVIDKYKTK
ncbi:MAG: response regulator, partial [Bacteroidales bacterium]|nr:response regulator [Bacteroidales bacterium]